MFDLKGYGPELLTGAVVTIELAFLSLALALTLGLIGASSKLSSPHPLHTCVGQREPSEVVCRLHFLHL